MEPRLLAQVSDFKSLAVLHVMYGELEATDGWKRYIARVQRMRQDLAQELLMGMQDKHGNSRDNEKRAVLAYMDRMLILIPATHRQYEELRKKQEQQDAKMQQRMEGGLHGNDIVSLGHTSV